jgi:AcrR family transcriptional regulator
MNPVQIESISLTLKINPNLSLRDPQKTALGRKIIKYSILLINEIGLENFTFKKVAERIQSTEASIYRYFENKHLLFIYLLNWYWEWIKFRIDINVLNITDPVIKLKKAIRVLVDASKRNTNTEFVDEDILHQIVVSEGTKGYHTISIDEENREGFFVAYKSLCEKIMDILLEINPDFPYPRSVASTLVETANNNIYFASHLPRLTDIKANEGDVLDNVGDLVEYMALKLIGN